MHSSPANFALRGETLAEILGYVASFANVPAMRAVLPLGSFAHSAGLAADRSG